MTGVSSLIKTLCPDGVPLKQISDLGSLTRGKRFVKADVVDDGIPCVHYGEMYTHYGVWTESVKSHIDPNLKPQLRFASEGDVIIVGAGENDEDIGIGLAWLGSEDIAIHDACYILKHNQNPKYISYYLRTSSYHHQIKKYVSRGKICSISLKDVGKATIPVPPIEIQNEIVRILDCFTLLTAELTAELNAELTARKLQYEFYRDKLLSFDHLTPVEREREQE